MFHALYLRRGPLSRSDVDALNSRNIGTLAEIREACRLYNVDASLASMDGKSLAGWVYADGSYRAISRATSKVSEQSNNKVRSKER